MDDGAVIASNINITTNFKSWIKDRSSISSSFGVKRDQKGHKLLKKT
jgi:hypothetical protein